jgi:segregation and condensation protein B
MIEEHKLKQIIEGALLAAGKPLPIDRMEALFNENERPEKEALQQALDAIAADCQERGFELKKVSSGYRFQVRQELSEWVGRLWEEKPQRYSRALMETLSIIAYRQPITRGDIEKIRGVAVSTQIVQTLLEHEWVRVVGYRDVPGRPAMYATTRQFLDYFNLSSLEELPPLSEIRDLEEINRELSLDEDKPAGRIIEFPNPDEGQEEVAEDEEEAAAAAIGTRPISEILGMVDSQLGIAPVLDALEDAAGDPPADSARPVDAAAADTGSPADPATESGLNEEDKPSS